MAVIGFFISCETRDTKSLFISSSRLSAIMLLTKLSTPTG